MIDKVWNAYQDKMIELAEQERGDGGGSGLTSLLLTIGGVVAATAVVGVVAAAIANKTGDVTTP